MQRKMTRVKKMIRKKVRGMDLNHVIVSCTTWTMEVWSVSRKSCVANFDTTIVLIWLQQYLLQNCYESVYLYLGFLSFSYVVLHVSCCPIIMSTYIYHSFKSA